MFRHGDGSWQFFKNGTHILLKGELTLNAYYVQALLDGFIFVCIISLILYNVGYDGNTHTYTSIHMYI